LEKPRLPDTPFWVEPESVGPQHLKLSLEESHHLVRVHRAKPGTPFQATDGAGGFFECVLESVERRVAVGRIVERREDEGELPRRIEILVGMPDRRAVEQVVTHAVPLGVSSLDFVACERSERGSLGPQQLARLLRVARAALKQSRRSRLPTIGSSRSVASAAKALRVGGERFFADPDGRPFGPDFRKNPQAMTQLAVGPPGGFTESERQVLLGEEFVPIYLGPSRLTTETAVLALLGLARNPL
jgi:16S rRNA (uracil1498-N3)-methyltransferase